VSGDKKETKTRGERFLVNGVLVPWRNKLGSEEILVVVLIVLEIWNDFWGF
jgi:hypothetical protein